VWVDAVEKVFLAGELNFSAPPVHAARADVREHVESQEGDQAGFVIEPRGCLLGGATVARIRRPLPRKAAVAADMIFRRRLTQLGRR
jgi:hypothetical protein